MAIMIVKPMILHLLFCVLVSNPLAAQNWEFNRRNSNPIATVSLSASTPNGTVPAQLSIERIRGPRSKIIFQLEVFNFDTIRDFDFSDFEGPDAPFGKIPLATISVRSNLGNVTVKASGAGWISVRESFIISAALSSVPTKIRNRLLEVLLGRDITIHFSAKGLKAGEGAITATCSSNQTPSAIGKVVKGS